MQMYSVGGLDGEANMITIFRLIDQNGLEGHCAQPGVLT